MKEPHLQKFTDEEMKIFESKTLKLTLEQKVANLEDTVKYLSDRLDNFENYVFNELESLQAQENTGMMNSVKALVKIAEELQAENKRLKNGN